MKKIKMTYLLVFPFFFIAHGISAQTAVQKANYVVSIARNIEWPEKMRKQTFKVAVYGSFTLYRELSEELMDKSVYNRNFEVSNINRFDDLKLTEYHIIYIAKESGVPSIVTNISKMNDNRGSLLLTEKEGSLNYGAGINFITREGKLYFEVSENNLRVQGLKITTSLLNFSYNGKKS